MKTFILALASIILLMPEVLSQVTIGSHIPPNNGSLLDIKESTTMNDNTATRGIAMPRVKLTDRNNLFPMLETTPGSGVGNDNYNTPALKIQEDKLHVGLTVYHVDRCTLNGTGLYAWTGTRWEKLGENKEVGLKLSQSYFTLPSGMDLRTITAQNLTVNWLKGPSAVLLSQTASENLPAVPFTSNPLPATLTSSPSTIKILPDPMSPEDIEENLWASKETQLLLNDAECNDTKAVILNQTNYALVVNNSTTQYANNRSNLRHLITHIDAISHQPIWVADYFWLSVKSNATWKSII